MEAEEGLAFDLTIISKRGKSILVSFNASKLKFFTCQFDTNFQTSTLYSSKTHNYLLLIHEIFSFQINRFILSPPVFFPLTDGNNLQEPCPLMYGVSISWVEDVSTYSFLFKQGGQRLIRLINSVPFTYSRLTPLKLRRNVAIFIYFFYLYCHINCFSEFATYMPQLLLRSCLSLHCASLLCTN